MTRNLRINETWSHPVAGGKFHVHQHDGYYETWTDKGGPVSKQRFEGWYEIAVAETGLNGADEYVADPYNPSQKVPAWRAWAIRNKRGTYED